VDGIVLGMTTLPAVKPGEPVCHIAIPKHPRKAGDNGAGDKLHRRARKDLATSIAISEREGNWDVRAEGEDG
ncbi:MAG TPA: hypothetical protein VGB25_07365, partial [Candidatus Binatia bacterium]